MLRFFKTLDARWLPKDPLFRLFVINGFAGLCIAIFVLAGIFYANIGNLRVLVQSDENPIVPVLMLAGGLFVTLGSVVIGSAIMLLSSDTGRGTPGGGNPLRGTSSEALVPVLAPVRAQTRRR